MSEGAARLAAALRIAAALAVGLLLLGGLPWPAARWSRACGLVVLFASPWLVVTRAAWGGWRAGRRWLAGLALTLVVATIVAFAVSLS